MKPASVKDFIANPILSVAWKAALFYVIKKLYKLRKGLFVFLKSVLNRKDLISEIGPSVLATSIFRCFRYTKFGERYKDFSTFVAALAFFSSSRWNTCKLLASYLASCWIFEILKTWDRITQPRESNPSEGVVASKDKYKQSTWVSAANVGFTGLSCGFFYYRMPELTPKWFSKAVAIVGGHTRLKKGRLAKYVKNYMQHCSGHHHVGESCTVACLQRIPITYVSSFFLGVNLQIPSLILKQNLEKSLYTAHELSLFVACQIFLVCSLVCLGNAIFVKKGVVKQVYRYFHTVIVGFIATWITSRCIVRNVYWDEFFGVSFGQVTLHCFMELCGSLSFPVVGILALNALRKRTEQATTRKLHSEASAVANFLVRFCIGRPIAQAEATPEIIIPAGDKLVNKRIS